MAALFDYPDAASAAAPPARFLADWSDADWDRLLMHAEVRRVRAGEFVIRAGEHDRALFILAEGTLEVVGPKGRPTATIEAGSIVGEQVFVDGQVRSADVRALTQAVLMRLSVSNFEVFAVEEPDLARAFLFDIARILSLRLRETARQASRLQ